MWSIESNEVFNFGICGSRSVEGFVFFLLFSGMIIPPIFDLCQECVKGYIGLKNA
ncbi:MAG: hypothetical protein RL311_789 [Bacteroidota bacterium]|jgi:hypothetical protein